MTWPKGQWNPWFQSTHSLRSATTLEVDGGFVSKVSIHALLAECDGRGADEGGRPCGFNPRTPCGVRRYPGGVQELLERFQSTHSLRSATYYDGAADATSMVSIHALLAECDPAGSLSEPGLPGFNPRTPCGVRPLARTSPYHPSGFNPRTPCGVRLVFWRISFSMLFLVSIHALLAECDFLFFRPSSQSNRFQSTHSLRSATYGYLVTKPDGEVSIHALLAECDFMLTPPATPMPGFNPRTPFGVRLRVSP